MQRATFGTDSGEEGTVGSKGLLFQKNGVAAAVTCQVPSTPRSESDSAARRVQKTLALAVHEQFRKKSWVDGCNVLVSSGVVGYAAEEPEMPNKLVATPFRCAQNSPNRSDF